MSWFIIKCTVFLAVVGVIFLSILTLVNGQMDPYYSRFTSAKQENLIIGTSRAAQALQPKVLEESLGLKFINYAFTVTHSPFGSVYFNSVRQKIKPETVNGTFIVSVDPWSISGWMPDPNDSTVFTENQLCVANTSIVDMNPNFQYLLENYSGQYYQIPLRAIRYKPGWRLHDDGWLEVLVKMDSLSVQKRTQKQLKNYRDKNLIGKKFSSVRFKSLVRMIRFLRKYGDVYLVRLPVQRDFFEVESQAMPEFESKIDSIIPLVNGYYDMSIFNDEFAYVDGSHLHKDSGKEVSKRLSEWIQNLRMSSVPK